MVRLPAPDGGAFCIDSTEVTNAQYADFLGAKNGDTSGQPNVCLWNSDYAPGPATSTNPSCTTNSEYDPTGRADYPVMCVNWCDSYAYCAWAGKRLCGQIGGGPITQNPGDPSRSQWQRACTSGGQYAYIYGDSWQPGKCVDSYYDAAAPVATAPGCQSPDPAYAGVYDLIGNAAEWEDSCGTDALNDAGIMDLCQILGGLAGGVGAPPPCWNQVAPFVNERRYTSVGLGFRCCADN